jgi:hypothetical protein
MSQFWPPLYLLIERRRKELGLRKGELAGRCGCINRERGIPWIDAIGRGQTDHPRAQEIMKLLPVALEIDQEEFDQALTTTLLHIKERKQKEEAQREAEMRARFKPHGYLVTERSVPSQIVICGLTGGPERWLRIPLDLSQPPITFVRQTIGFANQNPIIPFFGRVLGLVINYTFDCSVSFDLDGNPIEALDGAYPPGKIELLSRGKNVGPHLGRALGLTEVG